MSPLETFETLALGLDGARLGSRFGYRALQIGRKPFAFFHAGTGRDAAFKLPQDLLPEYLVRDGFSVFDPAGKGKLMRNCLQVPFEEVRTWQVLAQAAHEHLADEISKT